MRLEGLLEGGRREGGLGRGRCFVRSRSGCVGVVGRGETNYAGVENGLQDDGLQDEKTENIYLMVG